MTTITDQLADALRAINDALQPLRMGGLYLDDNDAADLTRAAREAIAAYDAQRKSPHKMTDDELLSALSAPACRFTVESLKGVWFIAENGATVCEMAAPGAVGRLMAQRIAVALNGG